MINKIKNKQINKMKIFKIKKALHLHKHLLVNKEYQREK